MPKHVYEKSKDPKKRQKRTALLAAKLAERQRIRQPK